MMIGKLWLFDNNLFTLQDLDGLRQIEKVHFDSKTLWIQLHKLPMMCMTGFYGNLIGKTIGKVIEVDVDDDDTTCGLFLCVRVEVNLFKPLPRGRSLKIKGNNFWIPLKYEKLPWFCFSCGRITHESPCTSPNNYNDSNQ